MRPPRWAKEETILALDLYMRMGWLDETHPEVVELSDVLQRLDIHEDKVDESRFRNANGVSMKMANFQSLDPEYTRDGRVGLSSASALDKEVWAEFANRHQELHALAQGIRATAGEVVAPAGLESVEAESYAEGRYAYRVHRSRERNPAVTARKKEQARLNGSLRCEVCGLAPRNLYGDLGDRVIECHHLVPIAEYVQGQRTRLEDLALLCANCHKAVHAAGASITPSTLKTILVEQR